MRWKLPSRLHTLVLSTRNESNGNARSAGSSAVSRDDASSLLVAQRRNRPVSPHLSIYRPQVTWIASGLNRFTGVMLSGTFYLFGIAYLVAPTLGWHLESASLAASFAALPIVVKLLLKTFFALPFTFHSVNSLRHLVWDSGAMFTNKQVMISGWVAIGVSVVAAAGLTFL